MMNEKSGLQGCLRVLCWAGLVCSAGLIYLAYWFNTNIDVIIRIPFVMISGVGGVMLGFSCLIYLVKGRFSGMVGPF